MFTTKLGYELDDIKYAMHKKMNLALREEKKMHSQKLYSYADIMDVRIYANRFVRTTIQRSYLLNCIFEGCKFSEAVFVKCILDGVIFRRHDIKSTQLSFMNVEFINVKFESFRSLNVIFNNCTFKNCEFVGCEFGAGFPFLQCQFHSTVIN